MSQDCDAKVSGTVRFSAPRLLRTLSEGRPSAFLRKVSQSPDDVGSEPRSVAASQEEGSPGSDSQWEHVFIDNSGAPDKTELKSDKSRSEPRSDGQTNGSPEREDVSPRHPSPDTDDDSQHIALTNQLRAAEKLPPLPPPPSSDDRHTTSQPAKATSFMSGIKERLQDPLNAFMEKFDGLSEKGGILDLKRIKKDDSRVSDVRRYDAEQQLILTADKEVIDPNDSDFDLSGARPSEGKKRILLARSRPASFDSGANILEGSTNGHPSVTDQAKAEFPKSCSLDTFIPQGQVTPKSSSLGQTEHSPMKTANDNVLCHSSKRANAPSVLSAKGGHELSDHKSESSDMSRKAVTSDGDFSISYSDLLGNGSGSNDSHPLATDEELDEQFYDPQDTALEAPKAWPSDVPPRTSSVTPPHTAPQPGLGRESVLSQPFVRNLLSILVGVVACVMLPLPSYLSGVILGAFLSATSIFTYLWMTTPHHSMDHDDASMYNSTTLSQPPHTHNTAPGNGHHDNVYKGWMNELRHYDPYDYHIGQTASVFIQLDGTKLRLQTPKKGIPRRALWSEPAHYSCSFVRQRHFELTGCTVSLLPSGLIVKRLWSKKYPICVSVRASDKETKLYLFARCARQKEEWFRRLVAASSGQPLVTGLADIMLSHRSPHTDTRSTQSERSQSQPDHRSSPTRSRLSPTKSQPSPTKTKPSPTKTRSSPTEPSPSQLDLVQSQSAPNEPGALDPTPSQSQTVPSPPDPEAEPEDLSPMEAQAGRLELRDQSPAAFLRYMARSIPLEGRPELPPSCLLPSPISCEPQVAWVNALVTRCFWDFLREPYWIQKLCDKLQKKLNKIHIPYFIDELCVSSIDLGGEMPAIRRAGQPSVDERGLWIDLDVAYTGGFSMALETKCNLMKLTKSPVEGEGPQADSSDRRLAMTDSGEEDSAESTTDDEADDNPDPAPDGVNGPGSGGRPGHRLLRFVDKLSQSKYFQRASEYKYVKRAMEGLSNTRLLLKVSVKNIAGTLAVNIPPPPSDRLWYGFRKKPRLWLVAKPFVGEREVGLTHVCEWIEKKLQLEFERVLVMPNMDDVIIPLLLDQIPRPNDGAGHQATAVP